MSRIITLPFHRGYSAIGLYQPKSRENVGSVLRAAFIYGAALVATTGQRYKTVSTDTINAVKHLPLLQVEDLFSIIPYDCIPIAVDILPDAILLPTFRHPDRAFYIFGPEDGTLGKNITNKCKYTIKIPIRSCMNLAATVNVILYDRLAQHYTKNFDTTTPFTALCSMG
jgi:tRNA(Leu) C34 or U34 (ribose-2'-O)-methylase TrmL